MGVLHQQSKMFKKLSQLDLFERELDRRLFAQFIHEDLERIIPKPIPINSLGLWYSQNCEKKFFLFSRIERNHSSTSD